MTPASDLAQGTAALAVSHGPSAMTPASDLSSGAAAFADSLGHSVKTPASVSAPGTAAFADSRGHSAITPASDSGIAALADSRGPSATTPASPSSSDGTTLAGSSPGSPTTPTDSLLARHAGDTPVLTPIESPFGSAWNPSPTSLDQVNPPCLDNLDEFSSRPSNISRLLQTKSWVATVEGEKFLSVGKSVYYIRPCYEDIYKIICERFQGPKPGDPNFTPSSVS
jgi:hypothetical protein